MEHWEKMTLPIRNLLNAISDNDCAPIEDSDQPGHLPSLIRVFACAQLVAKGPSFLHADSEDSNQTGWMPRLIWVFAGRSHFVGFVMSRLKYGIVGTLTVVMSSNVFRSKIRNFCECMYGQVSRVVMQLHAHLKISLIWGALCVMVLQHVWKKISSANSHGMDSATNRRLILCCGDNRRIASGQNAAIRPWG